LRSQTGVIEMKIIEVVLDSDHVAGNAFRFEDGRYDSLAFFLRAEPLDQHIPLRRYKKVLGLRVSL
jgi:hypothetical protein